MAETYGVFDIYALQPVLLATLAAGLRPDSRIKMKLAGTTVERDILLLAAAVDRLSLILWMQSEDGRTGKNRPSSIVDSMTGVVKNENGGIASFDSSEAFEAARKQILKGGQSCQQR